MAGKGTEFVNVDTGGNGEGDESGAKRVEVVTAGRHHAYRPFCAGQLGYYRRTVGANIKYAKNKGKTVKSGVDAPRVCWYIVFSTGL